MDGPVSWRLEPKDLVVANQFHCFGRLLRWQTWLTYVALSGGIAVALGVMKGAPVAIMVSAGLFGLFLMLVVQLVSIVVVLPFRASRIFAQQKNLHGNMTATWDATGLRLTTDGYDGRTPWIHMRRWAEDTRNVRLYHSDNLFQLVPKRALRDEELASLRRAAAAAGVLGTSRA